MNFYQKQLIFITILLSGLFFVYHVNASETNGTIDASHTYAWSDKIGWVNFGCDNCGVAITDVGITGHAWNDNYGWINLSPTNSGVANNSEGDLSGSAWGENIGWIDFDNVSIDSSGVFSGTATGDNIGTLTFDCDNCGVRTDWRPLSARGSTPTACNDGLDNDGDGLIDYPNDPGCSSALDNDETNVPSGGDGGGGTPPGFFDPPTFNSPLPIVINNGEPNTYSNIVILDLYGGSNVERMAISNTADFTGVSQIPYYPKVEWDLCYHSDNTICNIEHTPETNSEKVVVYIKFFTGNGIASAVYSDDIVLHPSTQKPPVEIITPDIPVTPVAPKPAWSSIPDILNKIKDVVKKIIPEFLKPRTKEELPPAVVVPLKPPLVFRGDWTYLPEPQLRDFVFAPLPKEVTKMAKNFPELEKTFSELNIKRMTDLVRVEMSGVKFSLPGLGQITGLHPTKLKVGLWKWPKAVPLVKVSPEVKNRIPSEILFTRSGSELIDYNMTLSLSAKGLPQQKIVTIVSRPLHLVVRPKEKVKKVKGYIIYREKTEPSSFINDWWKKWAGIKMANAEELGGVKDFINSLPMGAIFGSLFFDAPTLATEQKHDIRQENNLVLVEFEYTDPDGDGLYTADIVSPVVDGNYEIITVLDYENPTLGMREIRLTTVVDPEGYVYEKLDKREVRIPGAITSLYWKNPDTENFELWSGRTYQQKNPQTTDVTGKYSFLVPPGEYYLTVEAKGYLPYKGDKFQVEEGSGVHQNIEMKVKYWWIKNIDWKTSALVFIVLALLFNFYWDKKRDREDNKKNIHKNWGRFRGDNLN